MFAEIRSKPSLPVHIPCTTCQDYFYLEDCGCYHFSKWESASAAWVIHLGSSDNFLWNTCVLFIPEGIPQRTSGDEYLWKEDEPGEQFVIKGIRWKCVHKPLCGPGRWTPLATQRNYQHNPVMFTRRELRRSQSACFIKTPSYKNTYTFILRGFICSKVCRQQAVFVCIFGVQGCVRGSFFLLVSL